MKMIFRVEWRRIFRALTVYMSITIIVSVAFVIGIDVALGGSREALKHLSPLSALLLLGGIVAVCAVFSFLLSQFLRTGAVTLDGEHLSGRNYWGRRRRIPLSDIARIHSFQISGLSYIVVASKAHGEVHILQQTENLDQLLALLNTYLPAKDPKAPTLHP